MMEKLQFDELLGGNVQLPQEVPILRLAAARANEIAAMTYSIENPQQSKLVFQKLPTHMRRRVMSHNAKRMPRRLREAHLKQMAKSGLPPASKRPSRKHRRRPKCLEAAYARRDARCVWLQTHIWHAKRFHMIEKWGHKIADHPNDKSFRACYRAIAAHCLLRDLSYYACLELSGPGDFLRENLKRHCNPRELSFGAKIYRQGSREGSLVFFKKDCYPRSPIGRVSFMWKPGDSEFRTLWIWVHPLVYKDFYREIVISFAFGDDNRNDKGCEMSSLGKSLSRFRLTGPLSLAILTDALRVPNLSEDSIAKILDDSAKSVDRADNASAEWLEKFYASRENLESLRVQTELIDSLRSLKSPSQLPPNSIISATVLDPRFFLPQKRTKTLANAETYPKIMTPVTPAHQSPLWDPELRKLAEAGCKTTHEINQLRSENLVPGVSNDDKFDEKVMSKVPVILIQNPGCSDHHKSIGFASGVDVIIPAKWSMPFWQSFVYRCARPGGLRESRSVAYEQLDLNSPEMHQPDIPSYDSEALATMNQLRAKYFRYPPNRRVNYTKFAITSPFRCEWRILMKEWTDSDEFHVMRDRQLLEILRKALHNPRHGKNKNVNGRKIIVGGSNDLSIFDKSQFESRDSLVPVKISIEGRGRPRNFAIICAPTAEDLATRAARPRWSGPVQKARSDPNERERRTLRKNHKIQLKKSNKRGYRCRRVAREAAELLELQKRSAKAAKIPVDRNFALKNEYREAMENLYLPKCEAVRKSCDREVMGFVTRGDFSFSEARGVGIGYVALEALLSLAEAGMDSVLIRNPQSRQYRLAKIEVLNQYR